MGVVMSDQLFISKPESFKVDLPELHLRILFMFLEDSDDKLTKIYDDLDRLLDLADSESREEFHQTTAETILDCSKHPGFTFELDDDAIIVIDMKCFEKIDEFPYFLNILSHEITHGVNYVFENLGLSLTDDEHRAIVTGNVMEEAMKKILPSINLMPKI